MADILLFGDSSFMSATEELFRLCTTTRASYEALAKVKMALFHDDVRHHEKMLELCKKALDVHDTVPEQRFLVETYVDPTSTATNTSHTPHGSGEGHCLYPQLFDLSTDPMQRMALTTAYEALEMSGYVPNRSPSTKLSRIGTFYGQTSDDWRDINPAREVGDYFITGGVRAFAPGRMDYRFAIDTATSSGAAALNTAISSLSDGLLSLGGVKTKIGHGEAAAGMTALVKALMWLKNTIPPHIDSKTFRKDLSERKVNTILPTTQFHWGNDKRRRVFINNFSAAGGNTGMLLDATGLPLDTTGLPLDATGLPSKVAPTRYNINIVNDWGYTHGNAITNLKARLERRRVPKVKCAQCDDCPEGFRCEHELRRHIRAKHERFDRKWGLQGLQAPGLAFSIIAANLLGRADRLRRTSFQLKPSRNLQNGSSRAGNPLEGRADWSPMSLLTMAMAVWFCFICGHNICDPGAISWNMISYSLFVTLRLFHLQLMVYYVMLQLVDGCVALQPAGSFMALGMQEEATAWLNHARYSCPLGTTGYNFMRAFATYFITTCNSLTRKCVNPHTRNPSIMSANMDTAPTQFDQRSCGTGMSAIPSIISPGCR